MRKKGKLMLILVVGLIAKIFLNANVVFADDIVSSTLSVSPPSQTIILVPGEQFRGALMISNIKDTEQNLQYSAFVGSFGQNKADDSKDDYGDVDIDTKTPYNQMMDWIVLDKKSGSVKPNEIDTLGFTINVPKDAPAGGQYATIIVRNEIGTTDNPNTNVAIQNVFQFASIIYAEVTGETRKVGEITENNIPSILFQDVLGATSMVRNNGNVHTDASYVLQVWPLFSDEELCTNEENPDVGLVLPETEKYHMQSCKLPIVGIFRAKQMVKIFGETSIVEKTIVVCPIWLMLIIAFLIILVIMWLIMRTRARKNNKRK